MSLSQCPQEASQVTFSFYFFYLIQVTFLKEEKDNQQKEVNKANQPKEIPEDQEIVDLDDCQKLTPKPKNQLLRTDSQELTPKYQTPQNE